MLTVAFHGGRIYEFYDIPNSIYDQLLAAQSHGKFFHANIRNRFKFRRLK